MLLSDLLRMRVVDVDGVDVGRVVDALLVQSGPVVGGFGHQLVVEGIAIGRRNVGLRLGYHRAGVKGPAPLRMLLERMERKARYARWDQVDSIDEDALVVRLRCPVSGLDEPPVTAA
ncbi:MAG: hypothetical protein QOK28_965 [Actinomycetota bacterium]|jgi:hypothetical protein